MSLNPSDHPLVVVADRFASDALAKLQSHPQLRVVHLPQFDLQSKEAEQVEALVIRTRLKIYPELLARLPRLKLVVTATSGFDHLDLAALKEKGILAFYCPQGNRESAAELTWTLMLACARKLIAADRAVHGKNWNRDHLYGTELTGKTYGIVGLGRIGRKIAKIAHGFDMRVISYDPYVSADVFDDLKVERKGFVELLRESDMVSLHVPYTRETHHMLNRASFSEMHPHAILVNASRGSVIRESDLIEALTSGDLAAAGLDVFEREPLAGDSGLMNLGNVVMTPHIGATTNEAFEKVSWLAAQTVISWREGQLEDVQSVHGEPLPPNADWYTHPKGFNS